MTAALLRIFAASALCMVLLGLSDGPVREVLRMGCAALMVLVTVSAGADLLPLIHFDLQQPLVIQSVQQAGQQAQQRYEELVSDALSAYIAQQGRAAGGECTGKVIYTVSETGEVTLQRAEVLWHSGDDRACEILRQALSHDFGLPPDRIIIREVTDET